MTLIQKWTITHGWINIHKKFHMDKNEYHKQKSQYQCCWQGRQWNISPDVITFVDENNHHPCFVYVFGWGLIPTHCPSTNLFP
jgi:hypothetical protein